MSVLLVPVRKDTCRLHAGADGLLGTAVSHNGKDKELLLSVSMSTIDRLLKADKKKLAIKGKSGTRPGKLLKKQIPVRTYYADSGKKPGFFEIDTVGL